MRLIAELVYGERFLHFFYHIDSKLRQPCPHASSSAGADHRAMFSLGNGYNIGGGRRGGFDEVKGVVMADWDDERKVAAYVRLLLVEDDDDVMLGGEAGRLLNPYEHHLGHCHSDDLEYLAASLGLRELVRSDPRNVEVVRAKLRERPAALDTLCRHLCVFPFIGEEPPEDWPEFYCKLFQREAAPTPTQRGDAYLALMLCGAVPLLEELMCNNGGVHGPDSFTKFVMSRPEAACLKTRIEMLMKHPVDACDRTKQLGRRAFRIWETIVFCDELQDERREACDACGKGGTIETLKKCERCRGVYYCSRDCQRRGWKAFHRTVCKAPGDAAPVDVAPKPRVVTPDKPRRHAAVEAWADAAKAPDAARYTYVFQASHTLMEMSMDDTDDYAALRELAPADAASLLDTCARVFKGAKAAADAAMTSSSPATRLRKLRGAVTTVALIAARVFAREPSKQADVVARLGPGTLAGIMAATRGDAIVPKGDAKAAAAALDAHREAVGNGVSPQMAAFLDRWVAGPDAPDQADPPSENAWRCILNLLPFDWHADVVHGDADFSTLGAADARAAVACRDAVVAAGAAVVVADFLGELANATDRDPCCTLESAMIAFAAEDAEQGALIDSLKAVPVGPRGAARAGELLARIMEHENFEQCFEAICTRGGAALEVVAALGRAAFDDDQKRDISTSITKLLWQQEEIRKIQGLGSVQALDFVDKLDEGSGYVGTCCERVTRFGSPFTVGLAVAASTLAVPEMIGLSGACMKQCVKSAVQQEGDDATEYGAHWASKALILGRGHGPVCSKYEEILQMRSAFFEGLGLADLARRDAALANGLGDGRRGMDRDATFLDAGGAPRVSPEKMRVDIGASMMAEYEKHQIQKRQARTVMDPRAREALEAKAKDSFAVGVAPAPAPGGKKNRKKKGGKRK